MRMNERWIWFDGWDAERDETIRVFHAFPGGWYLVRGELMLGPYPDETVLRAYRMARTGCIDGCELGPSQPGWREMGAPRPLQHNPRWSPVEDCELPPSLTAYDREGLEPVAGCCTVFDSWPQLRPGPPLWSDYVDQEPALWGFLEQAWNAHPAGSLLLGQDPLSQGLTIVDLAIELPPPERKKSPEALSFRATTLST